ncbi:MAG: NTP transferase domain-containing protein [Ancalomicrobiaceae bacterium]|nr:NTP transferase domain-containing protein [Ancalomicrobiaceae bacterium]
MATLGPPARRSDASRPQVAAIVLAAGLSSRMQAFKPLLPFGERTVIEHVVATLQAGGVEEIRVVTGHRAAELAPVISRLGVAAVHNPDFERGMYTSVRAGIASLPADASGALLLPVDIPLVRSATIAALIDAAIDTGATIVHPTFAGTRGHPPILARRLFRDIVAGDGEGGLKRLIAGHYQDAVDLPVIDRGILLDMDTQADYARLAHALAHRGVPDDAECGAMLDAAMTPPRVRRHARAVADLAVALAQRLTAAGHLLDIDLVAAGALLHDIAKGHPRHAELGGELIRRLGFADVAAVVERHMDLQLESNPAGEPLVDERAIVFLADKLVADDARVTLDQRFAAGLGRHAGNPAALAGVARRKAEAEAVLSAVEAIISLPDAGGWPGPQSARRLGDDDRLPDPRGTP